MGNADMNPLDGLRRVAVVATARTPFCKASTSLREISAAQLGAAAAREAVLRAGMRPESIDQLIFGMVSVPVGAPNVAREVVLEAGFPARIPAYTISRACISANQAVTSAADQIALGQCDVVVAGGVESLSDVPILFSRPVRDALFAANSAKTALDRLKAFRAVRPKDLLPVPPAIAEPSTGQTMGEGAEKMAKDFGISRAEQDRFAYRSHQRAVAAWESGKLARHVTPVAVPGGRRVTVVDKDNHPRKDSTVEGLARLKPVFDRKLGSVTAGNSSPLTDGAAALVLVAEEKAKAEGWPILGILRGYHYTAVDPFEHLLMGPVSAVAGVLDKMKLGLGDIDVIEMHEAFAAQILANIHGLASAQYCREKLGRDDAVGEIDPEAINMWGGSISLGHPFGATGGRLVMTLLDRLQESGGRLGLISACAAGAMGSALVFERPN